MPTLRFDAVACMVKFSISDQKPREIFKYYKGTGTVSRRDIQKYMSTRNHDQDAGGITWPVDTDHCDGHWRLAS